MESVVSQDCRQEKIRGHNIIVIGASAGGVEALPKVLGELPRDFPASIFVVLHVSAHSPSALPAILSRAGELRAIHPKDKEKIKGGLIYVAPPDHHLWIEDHHVRVSRGPKINRHRPAIDPLFETAAHNHGSRVVGVILTGALDDGTAGLHAIKKCGGLAVVQDPKEAMVPNMPESSLRWVDVDYCLPLSKIHPVLIQLAGKPPKKLHKTCPKKTIFDLEAHLMSPGQMKAEAGSPSGLICPECNGPLWELQDRKIIKFRCLVGHSFSPETLMADESEALERALWVAVKTLEERSTLLRSLAGRTNSLRENFEQKALETEKEARLIRRTIERLKSPSG